MQEYEITYLSDPSLDDEARGKLDASFDQAVSDASGTISHNTESIRRRLRYPIAEQRLGFVRVVQTTLDPGVIEELRATLRKLKGVMRVQLLQTALREQVAPDVLDQATKKQQVEPKKVATEKPAKEVSMEEVEEKIEQALDEEVT